MKFTYFGHSCFMVETGGKKFLFDPFISGNELTKGIVDASTITADYIMVSHGHVDHVADLVDIAKRTGAKVISSWEVVAWAQKNGVENVHPMNFGPARFEFGKVHYTPAQHSSSMPDGSYGGNPGGFLFHDTEKKFYYSGDTALTKDMELIPLYAVPDVAILPVGGNFTMDVDDALIAADMIRCKKVIGVHFDTFGYIMIDHEKAKEAFRNAGKELILPAIGESIEL
ncbi:MAG: metal-dependent hydrolase [Chitinophagaceae bacterium]|nr:metal-dependent hydrolase [Chitinophagaceae bacterium]